MLNPFKTRDKWWNHLSQLMNTNHIALNKAQERYEINFDARIRRITYTITRDRFVFIRRVYERPDQGGFRKLAFREDGIYRVHELRSTSAALRIGDNIEALSLDRNATALPPRSVSQTPFPISSRRCRCRHRHPRLLIPQSGSKMDRISPHRISNNPRMTYSYNPIN